MHIRSMFALALLAVPLACAQAAEGAPAPQSLDEAVAQRAQADAMRAEAERRYAAEQDACYGKFLVSDCLEKARKRHSTALIEARTLEKGARDFEREAQRQEAAAKDAQRAVEQPAREAEQREAGERYRAEEARRAEERAAKIADKERQAAEGRRKAAAEQAARQAKQEARARQDAERAAKKAAEAAGK